MRDLIYLAILGASIAAGYFTTWYLDHKRRRRNG